MRTKFSVITISAVALLGTLSLPAGEEGARRSYYEAFHAETAEADWSRAADLYEKVLADPDTPPDLRNRARRRLSHCLEKLGPSGQTASLKGDSGHESRAGSAGNDRGNHGHDIFVKGAALPREETCRPCHIPHLKKKPPEWAPKAKAVPIWEKVSLVCTGCHDGFVENSCGSGSAAHFMKFHPVGVTYRGPTSEAPERGGSRSGERVGQLTLLNRKVECTTCHFAHASRRHDIPFYLKLSHEGGMFESKLCKTCHQADPRPPAFFPGPPETARIQHLASFVEQGDPDRPMSPDSALAIGPSDVPLLSKQLGSPYGLAIEEGKLLLCGHRAGVLLAFDLVKGTLVGQIGTGSLKYPTNVSLAPAGELLVVDKERGVQVLDGTRRLLRTLERPGEGKPHGLAASGDRVFVSDPSAHEIRVYEAKQGRRVASFQVTEKDAERDREYPGWPVDLAVDPDGNLLLTDAMRGRVQRLSPSGKRLQVIGAGYLARPRGIACDREGRIYVADAGYSVVRIFDPRGQLLLDLGRPDSGERGRLRRPTQIVIDYDHADLFQDRVVPGYGIEYLIAVTNQTSHRKVEIYGFLERPPGADPAKGSLPEAGEGSRPAPPKWVSAHPHYRDKKCEKCHGEDRSSYVVEGTATAICLGCHEDWRGKSDTHRKREKCRPLAQPDCLACHDAHESMQKNLLLKPLPDLCKDCHHR